MTHEEALGSPDNSVDRANVQVSKQYIHGAIGV